MKKTSILIPGLCLLLTITGCRNKRPAVIVNSDPSTTQIIIDQQVGDKVHFDYDSSNITREASTTLDNQIAWLNANPGIKFVIEGHCDQRGTLEYNLALGQRRAEAVATYLTNHGIARSRIIDKISYGKTKPAVQGIDELANAQNRRVVLVVSQ